jgi:hypothetical protein
MWLVFRDGVPAVSSICGGSRSRPEIMHKNQNRGARFLAVKSFFLSFLGALQQTNSRFLCGNCDKFAS